MQTLACKTVILIKIVKIFCSTQ